MARKKVHYSFSKGYGNVKNSDAAAVRADIKEVLGIKFDSDFYRKKKDIVNIPAFLKENIELIFKNTALNRAIYGTLVKANVRFMC